MLQQSNQNMDTAPQPMAPQGGLRAPIRKSSLRARLMRRFGIEPNPELVHRSWSLPQWIATYAVMAYLVALLLVNVAYFNYGTEWYFVLFGLVWVGGFFFGVVRASRLWSVRKMPRTKRFEKKLFWTAFLLRAAYGVFIYFFYIEMNGWPYEFAAGDSIGYVDVAEDWLRYLDNGNLWNHLVETAKHAFSDMGYSLFIFPTMYMFERDVAVLIIRIIHAFFGAYTAVIIYRFTQRSMDEITARIAAIFCAFHPVLICYVGFTLKETFMTWLLVLFIDMADRMLRGKRFTIATVAPVMLTGISMFLFRTVLGIVAFMAVFVALMGMDSKIVSNGKKFGLGAVIALTLLFGVSDNIMREVNKIMETDVVAVQQRTMEYRYGSGKGGKLSGNKFANYAGATVFAPLILTIPFPTMVDVGFQQDMRLIHGGNWVRNVMSGWVIAAMFMLLLTGDWRNYTLPVAVLLGYLVVLVFSAFAQSLRFHVPVMPFEMVFAAYAITHRVKPKQSRYMLWCIFMILTCFAWNWFKLAGRGME